ncbi:unnamed protein product [Pleuronectes platessa]|uniref:Cadherin domain-containing protein n=1 Tax=Pleuronectes platessa TaxID=8262 RepID=A0A9N7YQD2_PLEPL|nr:unnamed protein product [Pleuronectes platessa]
MSTVSAVNHYSVPEEMEEGSVVANLATDLGLDVKTLTRRKMRVDAIGNKKYLDINKETGELFILERIDREFLCALKTATSCFLKLDATIENPIRMFNIEVEITDINDNAPHFRRGTMHLDISESSPIGERFSLNNAADPDVGTNSVKDYHLSSSEHFSIEIQTGRDGTKFADLILKKALDREKQAVHNLMLTAVDGGVPTRTGTASVIVRVLDVNDNAPSFDKDRYVVHSQVNENIELDTVIAVVSVSDKDSGDNGVVDLRIPDNMPFKLRESSDNYYELVVSEPLDREKVPEYDVTFTVTDRGSPPLSDNETMTLELLDVNDNVPQFPQSFYTIRVMENNAPGALLSSLTAFDPDLHENQYLVYFILEKEIANTSMSMLFSINPENGNLYALKTFDYEIEKEFLFHIEARDSGSPPLSSNVTVHIVIVDQNDNAPVIVSPWRAHGSVVEEKIPRSTDKGSLVSKVIALDTDSVHNSRITYQFLQVTDATLFSLDQYNGEIRTMRMFSYRDPRHQRLVVVAKDNGEPALSATVTIKLSTVETVVKAYSDMTEVPLEYDIFSDLNLYLVIGLGSVSFLLLITILVTIVLKCQKPKPSNAAPPCRNSVISERNSTIADSTLVSNDAYWYSLFLAETRKGKMVVRQPVPKGSRYIVSSLPRGTGLTDTSGSAASTLQHRDIFPFKARFCIQQEEDVSTFQHISQLQTRNLHDGARYTARVLETEMEEGSVVANLATDLGLDVKTLTRRKMRVDAVGNKKYLDINKETGDLLILERIDRELLCPLKTTTSCFLKLDATIENPIRMFNIEVEITDINDNAPHFRRGTMHLDISESSPIGERFSLNNAADPDVGTNSVKDYHLSSSEHFSIEIQTGRDGTKFADLILKKALDREKQAVHNLMLTAVDSGVPTRTGTASVIVRVLDVNDNAPSFDKDRYVVHVMENSPIGSLSQVNENIELDTVIAVVSVSDKDSGDNGVVDLRIPDNMPFKLRESSDNYYELVVSEPLDREKVPEYDVTFTVTDRGSPPLSDNETMTLELLDVNDNVPQFPQSFYTIRVMENNAPGALLSSLTAFDPDLHENQYLVYFILEKEIANTSMSMLFSINPENGNLYALKTFDYEIEKEFLFHIEARDSGSPPLSSNVTVHIVIVDQNDNAPVIVSPWRAHGSVVEEKIPRNTDKGSLVSKVIALDTDSVHNSRITYQFLQVTDATLFSLDQYNGEIRTMRMFSYRDPRHQRLVVVAKDNGEPALSATVTIKLSTVETVVKAYSDMTEVPLEYDIFSDLNLYLVIGLGSVSFLLLITILVTIVLKCQKPKPSNAAPPCRNSVISERNSTIADSTLVSNDAYWYSLFLAETRKGKMVVRQPVPKGSRYIVSSLPRGTGLTDTSGSAASTLQEWRKAKPVTQLPSNHSPPPNTGAWFSLIDPLPHHYMFQDRPDPVPHFCPLPEAPVLSGGRRLHEMAPPAAAAAKAPRKDTHLRLHPTIYADMTTSHEEKRKPTLAQPSPSCSVQSLLLLLALCRCLLQHRTDCASLPPLLPSSLGVCSISAPWTVTCLMELRCHGDVMSFRWSTVCCGASHTPGPPSSTTQCSTRSLQTSYEPPLLNMNA